MARFVYTATWSYRKHQPQNVHHVELCLNSSSSVRASVKKRSKTNRRDHTVVPHRNPRTVRPTAGHWLEPGESQLSVSGLTQASLISLAPLRRPVPPLILPCSMHVHPHSLSTHCLMMLVPVVTIDLSDVDPGWRGERGDCPNKKIPVREYLFAPQMFSLSVVPGTI